MGKGALLRSMPWRRTENIRRMELVPYDVWKREASPVALVGAVIRIISIRRTKLIPYEVWKSRRDVPHGERGSGTCL